MLGKYLSRAPVVWRAHLHDILGSLSDLASSYNKRACSDINRSEIRKLTHLAARRHASKRTLSGYYGFLLTESLLFFGWLDRYGQLISLSAAQLLQMTGFTMLATYLLRILCRASVITRLGLRQARRALSSGRESDAVVITFDSGKTQGQGALYLHILSPIRSVWRGYLAKVRPALIARNLFVGDQHNFFPSNLASCLRSLFKSSPLPSDLSLSQIRHQACRHVSELAHAGTSRYSAQMLAQLNSALDMASRPVVWIRRTF